MNANYQRAVDQRKTCPLMQEVKHRHLTAMGPAVLKAIRPDHYEVQGREGHYNPFTDTWTGRDLVASDG